MRQRLHKILARSTTLSLRRAESAIAAGEVTINGKVVTKLGTIADPARDSIKWNGKRVELSEKKFYLIYNKPKSCLVTKSDPEGRKTVWDDLAKYKDQVNAVGRLDYDSEGLLILTNDGELINRLTHPKHEIKKVYYVKVRGFPTIIDLNKLKFGLKFRGVRYRPAEAKIKSKTEKHTWVEMIISEGKNRQVRMMFDAIGFPVLKLRRIAIGNLGIRRLKSSEYRHLSAKEVRELKSEVGL